MGIAVGAGLVGGALISGYYGNQAAGQQANAENNAANLQYSMFQQQQTNLKPYYQAGYGALSQIQANMPQYNKPFTAQDFQANLDPGYQFRLDQGENAMSRAASASGGAIGGSQLQSLNNYAQNSASQEYQNAFNRYQTQIGNSYNRLASVAGLGQTALGTGTAAGSSAANGISSALAGIGSAQAAGSMATGNAISGGISSGINYYQNQSLINAISGRNSLEGELDTP